MTTTKTRITELLGIKYPIFQGGMAWIAEHTLASAVSNAGGLGIIAGGSAPIDYLRDQIRQTKAAVNGKPFGVNIMLMSPNADDLAQLVIDEGVPVVTTGAGNPGKYMAAWKEVGSSPTFYMERSRHKGDTCRSVSCSCKENGKSRR